MAKQTPVKYNLWYNIASLYGCNANMFILL